jgi:hypothetical protein
MMFTYLMHLWNFKIARYFFCWPGCRDLDS